MPRSIRKLLGQNVSTHSDLIARVGDVKCGVQHVGRFGDDI
jgi:hypothetical protein